MVLNPGSEKGLLAICLKEPDKIIEVENAELFPEHFGVLANRYIYMAMLYLYSKKVKPNSISILEALSSDSAKRTIEDIGGMEYIDLLFETDVQGDSLGFFIDKIKQSYTRRMLLKIAEETKNFAISSRAEVLNPTELTNTIQEKITNLSVSTEELKEVYKMGDETEEVLQERLENPNTIPGLEVGWPLYDEYTNGALPGDLIILAAESKTGKSVILTNWAKQIAIIDKIPILYIDTEMNHREQEDRLLSMLSGIPHKEIINGMYVMDTEHGKAVDKIAKIKKAQEQLQSSNYYHIYMPKFSIEKITALTKKFILQFGIKAMFFDYIKLPSDNAGYSGMKEYQSLGFFTSGLKELAGTLKIPVFAATQENRENLGSMEKDASNIGGSYRILQLASKLMFLVNKTPEQIAKDGFHKGNQVLLIKYQRNAESDCPPIHINFNKPTVFMQEV